MSLKRRIQKRVASIPIYPSWCADSWVMHQIFRKLGFTADDIYFDVANTIDGGPNCILVSIKQGNIEFSVNLGRVESKPEETYRIWNEFIVAVNTVATDAEHKALWEASELEKKLPRTELILRIIDKGINIPSMPAHDVEMLRKAREQKNTGEN